MTTLDHVVDTIGFMGNVFLAINAYPLVFAAFHKGKLNVPNTFLNMWLAGEILTMVYLYTTKGFDGFFAINYTVNIAAAIICIKYNEGVKGE